MAENKQSLLARLGWLKLAALLLLLVLLCLFPPFRLVRVNAAAPAQRLQLGSFEAVAFADEFWTKRLLPATREARPLPEILAALKKEPKSARALGKQVGVDGPVYFFLRGKATVSAVERNRLILRVEGFDDLPVALRCGPVFGNALRDGCGLLEVNQVPGLQEFNALSAELNRLVEARVMPALRSQAKPGDSVAFAGCAEAPETLNPDAALLIVPVSVELKP